jgi:hypothetical protein
LGSIPVKLPFIGLALIAVSAPAVAQVATPILPPAQPGPAPTGTFTMSGCVSSPGVGTGLITMMSPRIVRSAPLPEDYAASPPPQRIEPLIVSPEVYEPPSIDEPEQAAGLPPGEVGAVGTVGTTPPGIVGTLGPPPPPLGYRLTGSDMSSWVGRRVQVVGTMDLVPPPIIPGTVDTTNPGTFPEFSVQSVLPLTGACPQR